MEEIQEKHFWTLVSNWHLLYSVLFPVMLTHPLFEIFFIHNFFFLACSMFEVLINDSTSKTLLYESKIVLLSKLSSFDLPTHSLIIKSIKCFIFDQSILLCMLKTLSWTETSMAFILFTTSENTRITRTITTIFTMICVEPRINTLTYRRMCISIPYFLTNHSIKSI